MSYVSVCATSSLHLRPVLFAGTGQAAGQHTALDYLGQYRLVCSSAAIRAQQQAGGKVTLALGSRSEMFLLILKSACWRLSQHLLHACHSAAATESTGRQQACNHCRSTGMGVDCLCRLTRNALAHGAAWPKQLLPDPIIEELPEFKRSAIAVCRMLPELLGYSEIDFIAKVVDMITDLAMGPSAPSSSGALSAPMGCSATTAAPPGPTSSNVCTAITGQSNCKSRGLAHAAVSSRLLLRPPLPTLPRRSRPSLMCRRRAKRVPSGGLRLLTMTWHAQIGCPGCADPPSSESGVVNQLVWAFLVLMRAVPCKWCNCKVSAGVACKRAFQKNNWFRR